MHVDADGAAPRQKVMPTLHQTLASPCLPVIDSPDHFRYAETERSKSRDPEAQKEEENLESRIRDQGRRTPRFSAIFPFFVPACEFARLFPGVRGAL